MRFTSTKTSLILIFALLLSTTITTNVIAQDTQPEQPMTIHYKTIKIENVNIFYREAGPKDAPVVLLLHGFPTSSSMFRNLIPKLAEKYHVIAPDYPGFGQSDSPDPKQFVYTFDHLANI